VDKESSGPWARSGTRRLDPAATAVTSGRDAPGGGAADRETDAGQAVTALYQAHALGLTRLAFLMLGNRQAAEDVVQEAFCGLYRAWDGMSDHTNALGYVRVSVLNGSRSALRRAKRIPRPLAGPTDVASAEVTALAGEERREMVAALRRLPPRQREALVLRYFADLPEHETALAMGVSRGTVKSTTARALAALGRMLKEEL
jgi:RNA polymerase sigma-70 factor (sigma-E family)